MWIPGLWRSAQLNSHRGKPVRYVHSVRPKNVEKHVANGILKVADVLSASDHVDWEGAGVLLGPEGVDTDCGVSTEYGGMGAGLREAPSTHFRARPWWSAVGARSPATHRRSFRERERECGVLRLALCALQTHNVLGHRARVVARSECLDCGLEVGQGGHEVVMAVGGVTGGVAPSPARRGRK
jgi:hypothetical protein